MDGELVKRLREVSCGAKDTLWWQAADAIEELQKAVNFHKFNSEFWKDKYNSLADEKWISVTERLPDCFYGEEIGNVEWISHGTVYAGCFGRGGKFRDAYFRVWNDATEGIDAIDAEYWRFVLLPEPPKEET